MTIYQKPETNTVSSTRTNKQSAERCLARVAFLMLYRPRLLYFFVYFFHFPAHASTASSGGKLLLFDRPPRVFLKFELIIKVKQMLLWDWTAGHIEPENWAYLLIKWFLVVIKTFFCFKDWFKRKELLLWLFFSQTTVLQF